MSQSFAQRVSWMLAAGSLLLGASAAAADPWTMAPGEFYTNLVGARGTSTSFFDQNRDRPPLVGGGSVEERTVNWSTELGWKKRVSFLADVPFLSRSRVPESSPEATTTGLGDLSLGLKAPIRTGPTAVALSVLWETPLGYNRNLDPPLGGGRQSALGLLEVGTEIPSIQAFFELGGGYRTRIDGFTADSLPQDEVVASADFGWWFGHSLMLAGDYRGRFESSSALHPATEHEIGAQLIYRVDEFLDIFAGTNHTAAGENVLHVAQYYAGIATRKTGLSRLQGYHGGSRKP